ncbi:hypothetical protein Btru_017360 [Bulinus truncatus]|nr:hypothetical protein Btru_017360 [Bulinus truncatus]
MPPASLSVLVNQTVNWTYSATPAVLTLIATSPRLPQTTSSGGSNVGRGPRPLDNLDSVNQLFVQVVDPITMATGIVGNALLILVFLITPLRLRPLSHTIAGLGVVNLMYTLTCMLIYLTKKGVLIYTVPGVCQLSSFTLVFSKSIEAWLIFMSHLNRLNAHTKSGHDSRRRRVFNTKFAVLLVALLVSAPLLHVLWSVEVMKYGEVTLCVPMKETLHIHLTIRKLEMIASVFLPLTLMSGVDLMLLLKLAMFYTFRDEDDDDDMNIARESPSSVITDKCPGSVSERYSPQQEIVYVHHHTTGSRLSTIDELSSSVGRATAHHGKDSTCGGRPDHKPRGGNEDTKKVLLDFGRRQSGEATSPISFHFLFDTLSQSSAVNQLPILPVHKGLSIESLNFLDTKSQISTPDLETSEPGAANNDCFRVNVEVIKSTPTEQESKQFHGAHPDGDRYTGATTPAKFYSFVLSNLKLNKSKTGDSYSVDYLQDSLASSDQGHYKRRATSLNNSYSDAHWRSCTFASYTSNASRTHAVHEDSSFPNDVTACTVSTMMTGILYAALVLPTTYAQALNLFTGTPTKPSSSDIQQAILYESLVKINAAYKFFLYFCLMPSFRYALVWLIKQWFPSKLTRVSHFCLWAPKRQKNESVYV